jgi:hypothetical protein
VAVKNRLIIVGIEFGVIGFIDVDIETIDKKYRIDFRKL